MPLENLRCLRSRPRGRCLPKHFADQRQLDAGRWLVPCEGFRTPPSCCPAESASGPSRGNRPTSRECWFVYSLDPPRTATHRPPGLCDRFPTPRALCRPLPGGGRRCYTTWPNRGTLEDQPDGRLSASVPRLAPHDGWPGWRRCRPYLRAHTRFGCRSRSVRALCRGWWGLVRPMTQLLSALPGSWRTHPTNLPSWPTCRPLCCGFWPVPNDSWHPRDQPQPTSGGWLVLCDSSPAHLGCRPDWHCRIVLARPRLSYKRQPAHLAATILARLPAPDYRDTPETAE